jgi:hypothetical protein
VWGSWVVAARDVSSVQPWEIRGKRVGARSRQVAGGNQLGGEDEGHAFAIRDGPAGRHQLTGSSSGNRDAIRDGPADFM